MVLSDILFTVFQCSELAVPLHFFFFYYSGQFVTFAGRFVAFPSGFYFHRCSMCTCHNIRVPDSALWIFICRIFSVIIFITRSASYANNTSDVSYYCITAIFFLVEYFRRICCRFFFFFLYKINSFLFFFYYFIDVC